jgi:hypothetical protein
MLVDERRHDEVGKRLRLLRLAAVLEKRLQSQKEKRKEGKRGKRINAPNTNERIDKSTKQHTAPKQK